MSGGKCKNIFNREYFWMYRVSVCGLEAIWAKFVGQPEKRATV